MKKMIFNVSSTACALFIVLGIASTASAQGQTDNLGNQQQDLLAGDEALHQEVLFLLTHYHGIPEANLLATPQAREVLYDIATEPDVFELHRRRALTALAQWPDDGLRALYNSVLESGDDMTRHVVIVLLADTFGEESLDALAPYLSSSDIQLRITAAQAIGTINTQAASSLLFAALEVETSAVVRDALRTGAVRVQ